MVWTLNPDIFLSGDVTRSSPVLYRENCVQDCNIDPCSVANIPRGVLEWIRIRVGSNSIWIRIRVGVEFVTPETKNLLIENFRIRVDGALIRNWEWNWLRPESPVHSDSSIRSIHGIYFFFTYLIWHICCCCCCCCWPNRWDIYSDSSLVNSP